MGGLIANAFPGRAYRPPAVAPLAMAIVGTESNDTLTGSEVGDDIRGLGGADFLRGVGGDDMLDGGASADTMFGGEGDDTLVGGDGFDYLNGGFGDDVVDGGFGRDRFSLHDNDAAFGGNVDLRLQGQVQNTGFGFDLLSGIENVSGSRFTDVIFGDDRANLIATSFSDVIWKDDDYADGGRGADTVTAGGADDTLMGGAGVDILIIASQIGVSISLARQGQVQDTGAGLKFLSGFESVEGDLLPDILTGDNRPNSLLGDGGDDTLMGSKGDDALMGDGFYGVEFFKLFAYGDDIAVGDDRLVGGLGADTLIGGVGSDRLEGGDGQDVLRYAQGDVALEFIDTIVGVSGDVIDLAGIDADIRTGADDEFARVKRFTGEGAELTLRFDRAAKLTVLSLDVDGDSQADMVVWLTGKHTDDFSIVL